MPVRYNRREKTIKLLIENITFIYFLSFSRKKIVVISYSLITMASLHAFGTALCQVLVVGVRARVEGLQAKPTFCALTLATKIVLAPCTGG